MRWLAVTMALLLLSVGLVVGIFVRDRDTSWRPPVRQLARLDAADVLADIAGSACHPGCAADIRATQRSDLWVALIRIKSRTECFEIDLDRFAWTHAHGLAGVNAVGCGPGGGGVRSSAVDS
jgi:hypothetical protein